MQLLISGNNLMKLFLLDGDPSAISDLQVKSAGLQQGRAELTDKIRERVYLAAFEYDEAAREFHSQEIAKRNATRMRLLEVE